MFPLNGKRQQMWMTGRIRCSIFHSWAAHVHPFSYICLPPAGRPRPPHQLKNLLLASSLSNYNTAKTLFLSGKNLFYHPHCFHLSIWGVPCNYELIIQ